MTLQLLVNGTDYTAKWRLYESRWTMQAWQGQSAQSEFILDAANGEITHSDMAARKIVEVWEDASGSPKCLYRGRIANKALGQGPFQAPGHAMRWALQCEDYNVELSGIRVINATRPEEDDDDRVEVIRAAYLAGAGSTHPSARDSTDLGSTYIGNTPAEARGLPEDVYTDTEPGQVLSMIADFTGRVFFVYLNDDGTGELAYLSRDEMAIAADISIVDDAEDEGADGVDVYAAYKDPQAGDHAGQSVLTGGAVRYGDGAYFEESDVSGFEAIYDKWETTVTNDFIWNETVADFYVNTLVAGSDESNTYFAAIDMTPDNVHRIKAGMMVPLIRKRANKGGDAAARAVLVTYNPVKPNADGETLYRVELQLGRPQFVRTGPRNRRHFPHPPQQPVPPSGASCTRYYFTNDTTGIPSVARDSSWNAGNGNNGMSWSRGLLKGSPTTTSSGNNNSWNVGTISVPYNFQHGQHFLALSPGSVTGTVRAILKARRRTGTGVTAAQRHQAQMVIRVVSSDGLTVRGTVLDDHSPVSLDSSNYFSTYQTIKFPASTTWADDYGAVLTPVTAQAGDWLVVEIGTHTVIDGSGTGALIKFANDGSGTDYPVEEYTTDVGDPWIDLCTAGDPGTPGDTPEDIGGTPAPGDDDIWAPLDHVHGHGDVPYDGTIDHDAASIEYENEESGLTADNVQDAIDEVVDLFDTPGIVSHDGLTGLGDNDHPQYRLTTLGGQDVISVVAAAGSTETLDLAAGNVHDVTLTADCTLTLTGATAGVACDMAILFRQGSGAPWDVTWPASVEWVGDTAPILQTAADAWDWVQLSTLDGGATWFGSHGGASTPLSDDTPLVEAGAGDPGASDEGSRSDHVHPAATATGIGEILISDTPSTPLVFADLIQNEAQDDLVYGDP